ncbi:unnamed protein product [Gordionus sp. m RMFG-2023]
MSAVKTVIGNHIIIRGCFYHLCQSTHRKIKKLCLESQYRTDEALSFFCGMLDGLAFVPLCDMGNAMAFLRSVTLSNVSREITRSNSQSQIGRIGPRFPPQT